MPTYTVRSVVRWKSEPEHVCEYLYEERITVWSTDTADQAILLAESEAQAYAAKQNFEFIEFCQSFWLVDSIGDFNQGAEVFSLCRKSDLDVEEYLDRFFDTGTECQTDYSDSDATEDESEK